MSSELVAVPFHGEVIEAAREGDRVWVSLRRCCENLGLDYATQLRKLKEKPWANVGEKPMMDASGREFHLTCVDLDTLAGWLFSIDARKVGEHVREKLVRYQREAARILADHFFSRRQALIDAAALQSLAGLIADELRPEIRGLLAEVQPPRPVPRTTVRERCRELGWGTVSPAQRDAIRKLALALIDMAGLPRPDPARPNPGCDLEFPEPTWGHLDKAVLRVWDEAMKRDQGGLFAGRP